MALIDIPPFPLWLNDSRFNGYNNNLLDANGEKAAYIVQVPKSGTIDRVCFRTNTVTTGDTVDVRIETLNASMDPSGALWGANTNAAQVILATDDNKWFEVTLTAGAVVNRGDWIAVVVSLPAAGSTGNLSTARGTASAGVPYCDLFTGTWAKTTASPIGAIRYSDGSYGHVPGMYPFDTFLSATFTAASTPDERGNKITVPFPCKVIGTWEYPDSGSGDRTFNLYSAADVLLASKAIDGDAAFSGFNPFWILFDNEVTLNVGDVVRLTKLATTATTVGDASVTCPTGFAAAMPGGGNVGYTSRSDAGAWTDTPNKQAFMGLIISAIDNGAGPHPGHQSRVGGVRSRSW